MFLILDTNHFTEFVSRSSAGERLRNRLVANATDAFVTIVTAHESLGGWFALVNRQPSGIAQIHAYQQLRKCIESMAAFELLDFDLEAAAHFDALKRQFPRNGTMDLKIAAICLAHDAMLLTRNIRDFEFIEGLRVENWLD